jgi:hypothetical protein
MPPELISLTVSGLSPEAKVTIFDAENNEAWTGSGRSEVRVELPRGFYTVRASVGTSFEEKFVRLAKPETVSDVMPKQYSPAPIFVSALSHEYYSDTSRDLSRTSTRSPLTAGAGADLFVFVRALDESNYHGADLGIDLSIADEAGRTLSQLDPAETKRDPQVGFVGLCAPAAPGFYRLVVGGQAPRTVALWLEPGWQTQVFLLHHSRPLAESLRIFMARVGAGFEPGDQIPAAVDAGLQALHGGSSELPPSIDVLLRNKFDNPMLGFIGAHLLLNRARQLPRDSPERRECGNLLQMVLGNLGWLAPNAPDTLALQTAAALFFGSAMPNLPLRVPPMLRSGLSAVVFAAAEHPQLIEDDSLADRVTSQLFQDSPWTTWQEEAPVGVPAPSGNALTESGTRKKARGAKAGRKPSSRSEKGLDLDWVEYALVDETLRILKSGKVEPIDIARTARQLGVTPNDIRRAIRKLDHVSLSQLTRLAEPRPIVRDLIAQHGGQLSLLDLLSMAKD